METPGPSTPDLTQTPEVPSAILPTGERMYVVGSETAVQGTIRVLQKFGFDRFRRLH